MLDSIIKAFLTAICITLAASVSTGLIMAAINANKADTFISDAVVGIEEGNLQPSVIGEWQTEASERGYQLDCTSKDTDGDGYIDVIDLQLTYPYIVPFLNTQAKDHTLKAYAR